jgi:hypothetical protein
MSGTAELAKRLSDPFSVTVNGGRYLESWSDSYMINGAHRECHPDFEATPIGDSPYGFLVCKRKISPQTGSLPENMSKELIANFQPYTKLERQGSHLTQYSQSYDMYNSQPMFHPKVVSQPRILADRRGPNHATLQGSDYFRTPVRYAGIGTEILDRKPGEFGYIENKYYFSAPPPRFDITQAVQPYELWRREQLRLGTVTESEMQEFEKKHTYSLRAATF